MLIIDENYSFEGNPKKDDSKNNEKINQLFESIIDSSYDAICVIDRNAMSILGNEAYLRLTGVKKEEVFGKSLYELIDSGVISDAVTLKVLKENRIRTIIQNINGKEFLTTGTPVYDKTGEIAYIVTNLRDMSELNKLKSDLNETKALAIDFLNKYEKLKLQKEKDTYMSDFVFYSKEINHVVKLINKISSVESTVILRGETGVGKEVFANMIHYKSKRATKPYIKVNCAAIPKSILESELFGYEKGAFTGADKSGKPGYFELAHGGTIFLDEIGEMALDVQAKLLRVLQEYEIMRVGGTKTVKVNVRIITATNNDLEHLIEIGKFRQDLFYRINVVPIEIPAVRNRKADIPPMAYNFLRKTNEKYDISVYFQLDVIRHFERYSWPGNIREMENLIERLAVMSDGPEITADHLPRDFIADDLPTGQLTLKEQVKGVEREIIKETLNECQTTRQASKKLGISQSTLVKKKNDLNI